jgi:hypothetical protein
MIMFSKKTEQIQRIVATKGWYIVVILQPCREVGRLFRSVHIVCCGSPKDSTSTLVLGKLSWGIKFTGQWIECLERSVRQLSLAGNQIE